MFGLQPTHWLIIAIVALLFFAPSRLPEAGRALRQTMMELRNSFKDIAKDDKASDEPEQKGK